jgi:glycosyltransferase involved in cell wall biosynthesis
LADGGAEAVLYRLITANERNAHEVISLMDRGKYGPLLSEGGIKVHALNMPRGRVTVGGLRRLWHLIRASNADVVQTWMYHADLVGGIAARLAGKGAVVWGLHNTYLDPLRTRLMARACAGASRVIPQRIVSCSSEAARLHIGLGYARDRITVVPNGYDLTHFRRNPEARVRLRAEWGVDRETMALGMVARWDPQKDHANLAAALTRLGRGTGREWRMILVGPGMEPSNEALVRLLEGHGVRDRTLLMGSRPDVAAVMNALDLHVLSSAAEAFPNVVAEAMACETPCVVTDTGDAGLIVGDTGWVVPPQDPERLAQGLQAAMAAMRDRYARLERQRAARERIQSHFSLDRMVRSYMEVWHEAASERGWWHDSGGGGFAASSAGSRADPAAGQGFFSVRH